MGFYVDLERNPRLTTEFTEKNIPSIFWFLFLVAGFALACMGLAAHSLLKDLLHSGSTWDLLIVGLILSAVPLYVFIGVKLAAVRKFIHFEGTNLTFGFRFLNRNLLRHQFEAREIEEILLVNRRPSSNVAPKQHDDSQYYIRGHWRLIIRTLHGKVFTLDKHIEKEVLHPLYAALTQWHKASATA